MSAVGASEIALGNPIDLQTLPFCGMTVRIVQLSDHIHRVPKAKLFYEAW